MTDGAETETWAVAPVFGAREVRLAMAYYEDKLGFACENGVFAPAGEEALYAEFVERGAVIVRPPVDAPNYGMRDFIVEDLDGNRLLFGGAKR